MVVHIFKLSDELFQDFEVKLNMEYFDSIEQICFQVKRTLETHLKTYNFSNLIRKLKSKNFHTHDYTFLDILKKEKSSVFWICLSNNPHNIG